MCVCVCVCVCVYIDRDWIHSSRINAKYERGVEEFIQFAQCNESRSDDEVKFRCLSLCLLFQWEITVVKSI